MSINNLMVREYLASLKEDTELDYLFPVLLNLMGFKIIATPKESKGQPQYGKDIVAMRKDPDGVVRRYYFELKGGDDKDIDDYVMTKRDGIMESFRVAKLVKFNDVTVPGFNSMPIKYVLVHNGRLKSNTKPLMEEFAKEEFPGNNFERWDISVLTDLFSQYLFGEYLLTDEESIRLFKRTLVFLDAPDYDFADLIQLIELQISKVTNLKGSRSLTKFFATANLLTVIIIHYSRENNNLHAARQGTTLILLSVWQWILSHKLENKKAIKAEFDKLLNLHNLMLEEYFNKLLPVINQKEGLFSERGEFFEAIGAPLRSFDILAWLIYHFEFQEFMTGQKADKTLFAPLRGKNKKILKEVVEHNLSCRTPVIDRHNIPIIILFLYYLNQNDLSEDDLKFLGDLLVDIFNNLSIVHGMHKRLPEFYNNLGALIEFVSTGKRPPEYTDNSSLLINILFELTAILDGEAIYNVFRPEYAGKINLQIADTDKDTDDFENEIFSGHLHDSYFSDINLELPEKFNDYKTLLSKDIRNVREYRTDKAGYPLLRTLAHLFYQNELLPCEWRSLLNVPVPTENMPVDPNQQNNTGPDQTTDKQSQGNPTHTGEAH